MDCLRIESNGMAQSFENLEPAFIWKQITGILPDDEFEWPFGRWSLSSP